MNPQLIQSILQMLRGGQQQNQVGFGAGNLSSSPGSDIAAQLQVGQPLGMDSGMSAMGGMSGIGGQQGGGGMMQNPMSGFGGGQPQSMIPPMLQPGRAGMNANRANQGWSSFMPDTTQTISSLMGQR